MTKAIFTHMSEPYCLPTPTCWVVFPPSSSATSLVEPVYIIALSAVIRKPFVPLMHDTTPASLSVMLDTFISTSTVQPAVAASEVNGIKAISAFAPLSSFSASPVQPLVFQSTPSNAVFTLPYSQCAGSASPLLRPAALSFSFSPSVASPMSIPLFSTSMSRGYSVAPHTSLIFCVPCAVKRLV